MEEIRKILLEEKEKIGVEIKSKQLNLSDIERDVGDEVDNSMVEQERELNLLLQDREKQHLEAIEEALQRIETGEYGFCDECGDQIDQKRLMVIPLAQLCIACQQNEERLGNINSFSRLPQQTYSMRDD
ncbi:MAG: TraR/DksA C4-type zinc finger protein [SAR324 cluster bacterium]|jgi:DnaK suppressor protein|nr:TraR/DksA C4-type zinc finger protein [SAR324 cluster bacterium]MEE1575597.1 TraR/DksA C4-type zinc finger protein [Deltaproteobacteria bacterium]MDP6247088.1 TraR/DksA C4-type zinc finger protein [SAR324 cluster bacterium]MDP6462922.1 TraR/DksA C4-type zinc finger protein [SAR324 cluster bacterium]MDP7334197.1 TraR/DksA C4-type zinc finger protein [SAR324 cluster bacterium]|tara:strand:- start:7691 stop:8077 length:387 start_codon:yes stop_codon:yes gene_type:complete